MSERLERLELSSAIWDNDIENIVRLKKVEDQELATKIFKLLNNPAIAGPWMVDAHYFECLDPMVPEEVRKWYCDLYLLFGLGTDGKFHSKWVRRDELEGTDSQEEEIMMEVCEKCKFEHYCCACDDISETELLERRIKTLETKLKTLFDTTKIQLFSLEKKIADIQIQIIEKK